jgi:hypothetical protein
MRPDVIRVLRGEAEEEKPENDFKRHKEMHDVYRR